MNKMKATCLMLLAIAGSSLNAGDEKSKTGFAGYADKKANTAKLPLTEEARKEQEKKDIVDAYLEEEKDESNFWMVLRYTNGFKANKSFNVAPDAALKYYSVAVANVAAVYGSIAAGCYAVAQKFGWIKKSSEKENEEEDMEDQI